MIRVALKGMAERRFRTVLTALAIVLGVAMVSGAFTLTDTMKKAADSLSSSAYSGTDGAVVAKTAFKVDQGSGTFSPTVPASVLGTIRHTPGVAVAAGDVTDVAKIIGSDRKPVGNGPYFGVGFDSKVPGAERLTPFHLSAGHWATGPGQVVIDLGTAKKQHLHVGGPVRISAGGAARTFTVVGTARFGEVSSIGTATAAIFDLRTAQDQWHKQGRFDSVLVRARPGTAAPALRSRIAAGLPASMKIESAEKQDRFTLDGLKHFLSIITTFLLAFGGVAVFVGAFTIYNTLSITVAQRSRELAALRTMGASRRQVLGSVVLEALGIGILASAVGIVAGLGLAKGLQGILSGFGMDLPQTAMGLAGRTVIVSSVVGIVVTVLAGLGPAFRATRVAPVAALREGAYVPPGRVGRRAGLIGGILAALGIGIVGFGMFGGGLSANSRLASLVPGCLALFLGVALLSPRLARPLASVLGRPGARLGGVAGRLARQNAMRNPKRTAVTAAALMVGIALVSFVAVLGQGLKQAATGDLHSSLKAGAVVEASDGFSPLSPAATHAARSVPGVRLAASLRQDQARAFRHTYKVDGVDPATWSQVWRYEYGSGSNATLRGLSGDGALVRTDFASKHHLAVGDAFTIRPASGDPLRVVVRGTVKVRSLNPIGLGDVTIPQARFASAFPHTQDRFTLVAGGSVAGLKAALASFPDAKAVSAKTFEHDSAAGVSQLLALVYVLLALAIVVSLFGIVNTLALAVLERTREIGMLRAVGMTRRQVRRMIRHESVVTALMGAALGIAVGLALGAVVTGALSKYGLGFGVPVGSLVTFIVLAVVAGMLAAIGPARRAARLDVLPALATQ
jgi:putative ABC transport system permease protein